MGWQRQFDDPIETPDGKKLHTLREAVATAAEMLTYAAECGTAWMFLAHMATPKAIHRHEVRQFDAINANHCHLFPGT